LRRTIFALAVVLIVGGGLYRLAGLPPDGGPPDLGSVETFGVRFDGDAGVPRVVLLLSPT